MLTGNELNILSYLKGGYESIKMMSEATEFIEKHKAFWKKCRDGFKAPPEIVVTGLTGAGKTVLANRLLNKVNDSYILPTTSPRTEIIPISSETKDLTLVVTRGRDFESEIGERLSKKEVVGIIHVMSNGIFNSTSHSELFVAKGLKEAREDLLVAEADGLQAVLSAVCAQRTQRKRGLWLIVAFNKWDLYDSLYKQLQVESWKAHFQEYVAQQVAPRLEKAKQQLGKQHFAYEVVPFCGFAFPMEVAGATIETTITSLLERAHALRLKRAMIDLTSRFTL